MIKYWAAAMVGNLIGHLIMGNILVTVFVAIIITSFFIVVWLIKDLD